MTVYGTNARGGLAKKPQNVVGASSSPTPTTAPTPTTPTPTVPRSYSTTVNPATGKSDQQVYDESQAVVEKAKSMLSPVTPNSPTPTTTTPDTGYYPRTGTSSPVATDTKTPKSFADYHHELMTGAKDSINALHDYENSLLAEQGTINQQNDRSTASVSTLTGLAGSTEANVQQQKTTAQGQQANKKIQDEINVQIQSVLQKVNSDAIQFAQFDRQMTNAENDTAIKLRAEQKTKATESVTALAQSGATADGYKATDPVGYDYLAKTVGGEAVLKAMFTLNRSQEQILDKKIEGGKYIISWQNPLTNKIRIETVDLGLPAQYTSSADLGDRIMFYDPNDPTKQMFVKKGLTPTQSEKQGNTDQLYTGLSGNTATAVRAKVSKFGSEPMVQNFATIQDGYLFAKSISDTTQNPADDQSLIYALAKALDPASVVREGEYATAQKYSQSWVNAFGKGVEQAVTGTGFLSETARKNIKKAIEQRYTASKQSYTNLQNQYTGAINSITGRSDGSQFLIDYQVPSADASTTGTDNIESQKQELRNQGYTDEQIDQIMNS